MMHAAPGDDQPTRGERGLVLAATLLAWTGAGVEMGLGPLSARPAVLELLFGQAGPVDPTSEHLVGVWFARLIAAFLFGGALGGWIFGWVADRFGRVRSLGLSVLCYSVFTALNVFVRTPEELAVLRFLASLGIGGTWPASVALLAEAWPTGSRPTVAGLLGAAANVGIFFIALMGRYWAISPENWREVALLGGTPAFLGILILLVVPESRLWRRHKPATGGSTHLLREALTPPILSRTLLGIVLGTVPLLGTWSSGKWLIPWADKARENAAMVATETGSASHPSAAGVQAVWAGGAILGSLLGGWIANLFGRRLTYFVISVLTLATNLSIYRLLDPTAPQFLPAVFILGLIGTVFFGWLPLYLPELFPTRVRGTGAGITYNTGRILSGLGVLGAGSMVAFFGGDYARVGEATSWIYLIGLVAICFAPDTTKSKMDDAS